jgi:glycosyltransferase involved in cell wall biosynthesis/MoaA/NifB/PqqE/SkfB family radical SAM enzyme
MDVIKSLNDGKFDPDSELIHCLLMAIKRNEFDSAKDILTRYVPSHQSKYFDCLKEYLKFKLNESNIDLNETYKIKENELQLLNLQSILSLQKPHEINFQITNKCNCKCKMCNVWKRKHGEETKCDQFKNLIQDPFFSEVQRVGITGGEPTLREDLFDFYKILPDVLSKFKGASFITNGILTNRAFNVYSKTFDFYRENGLSFQGAVSLDGLYDIHDNIRGLKGAFSNAVTTLFQLRDYGISTNVCCTIVKDNIFYLQDLLEWCKENNVPIQFRVGEFINRLDNQNETGQIRNFSIDEKKHLTAFFYHLLERYETDPLIRRTYYSILSILSGGARLITCPYQNCQSITIDSSECFMTCAPKGTTHAFTQDIQSCMNNTVFERLDIRIKYCDNCIHDYHSNYLPMEEWKISMMKEVMDNVYKSDFSIFQEVKSTDIDFNSIKKILLVGWYGTETAGDIAILGGIIKEYLHINPELEFILFSLFPYYTKLNLEELQKDIPKLKILLYDYMSPDVFGVIENCDAIVMAGGPLMDIPQISMIASLFKKFSDRNKIRIVEGCGVGPLNTEIFLNHVLNIVRIANYVSVRDQNSQRFLLSHGITKQIVIREDPSLAFISDFKVISTNDKKENVIRCYLRELTAEYPQDVDAKMAFEHIRIFLKNLLTWYPKYRIELCAMHYFPVGNDDRLFNKKLSSFLLDPRVSVIIKPNSVHELLTSMANAKYCVCMRYHSVLFASSTNVPFIAIDYTDGGKIYGFLSDSNQQNRMATLSNIHLISKEQFEMMTENQPMPNNNPDPIHIVQISTEDIRGGAAIAAYRLYTGLKLLNPNTRMLVKNKRSQEPDVIPVLTSNKEIELENELFSDLIHQQCINKNRTDISTTLFSYPIFGYDFENSDLLKNAHIINLHWVNFFCSISSFKKILGLKKPIVWTLHDQWLFTGGCHYTSDCDKYLKKCNNCPQLINDEKHLPHYFLEKKREIIKQLNPIIVTPSQWLAEVVKKTPVFQDLKLEVIPNSIDTSIYINTPKQTARRLLNLPLDGYYLLFGVENVFEKRKGIHHLISALKYCIEDPIFFQKVTNGEIKVVCFGDPDKWVNDMNIPIIFLGKIKSETELSKVYSIADVFLLPSIEDNLPNMVIEAMSCGTPTIAFNIGGIPEIIQNGVNGCIVDKGSESDYAKMILNLMNNPELCLQMSKNCRTIALNFFSLEIQAKRYFELYKKLVISSNSKTADTDYSPIHSEHEFLPDASDFDTDTEISEIIKEIALKNLIAKEIELRLIKDESNARYQQINILTKLLKESEADSNARMEQINELTKLLKESEADSNARMEQINELTKLLHGPLIFRIKRIIVPKSIQLRKLFSFKREK